MVYWVSDSNQISFIYNLISPFQFSNPHTQIINVYNLCPIHHHQQAAFLKSVLCPEEEEVQRRVRIWPND